MFASTQTLPPRTKRWAEAKVLADCVAIRVRLQAILYCSGLTILADMPAAVVRRRSSTGIEPVLHSPQAIRRAEPWLGDRGGHIRVLELDCETVCILTRPWFEPSLRTLTYPTRYRILAELLELGIQSGAQIPTVPNPVFPTAAAAATVPSPDYFSTPISSLNPLHVLQPPAYYFYTAAVCSIQRQQRYEAALAVEVRTYVVSRSDRRADALQTDALSSKAGAASGYVSTSPGFASEKKVDHSALIVELLTKAYGLLNRADTNAHAHNRLALFVAYRIAETYCRSQQYDMAIK